MPRHVPPDRFESLVAAGAATFIAQGFRRTQMQDVAEALGVAKGTVYSVVTSKDALFLACVRYADGVVRVPGPEAWPLPDPTPGELGRTVAERLSELQESELYRLAAAPADADPAAGVDTQVLLERIVSDLVSRLHRHRVAVKLVDRCAPEVPDLAALWFGEGRHASVTALATVLTRLADHGRVRAPDRDDEVVVVARTVVEACALWAVHLPWDPAPAGARGPVHGPDHYGPVLSTLFAAGLLPRG